MMVRKFKLIPMVIAVASLPALIASSAALAQIGNSAAGIGGGSTVGGIASHALSGISSAAAPKGPGLSRLPRTTTRIMPYASASKPSAPAGNAGNSAQPGVGSQSYGTAVEGWPYSHQRVAVTGPNPGASTYAYQVPVTSRPYRFAGKLWMRFGGAWYVCTASLVKKGVLITAAHCVHNYGTGAAGFADEVRWYPANLNEAGGPWSYYTGSNVYIPAVYQNGTDTCQAGAVGVVCNNDIATVVLPPRGPSYVGVGLGGWYSYGWNGYSYKRNSTAFGGATIAELTQIGYPVAWDYGYQMQRNNSFGKYIASTATNNGKQLLNTQIGSPMSGGSSGGPWLVNFGTIPTLTNSSEASFGAYFQRNTVVGVTSWGYIDNTINVQGASWFGQNAEFPANAYGSYGAGNIGALMQRTCTANPAAC